MNTPHILLRRIRWLTALFIAGLAVSGATAIPLVSEVDWLAGVLGTGQDCSCRDLSAAGVWMEKVRTSLLCTQAQFPFLFYGTDWLAFGHCVIAVAFLGALRDPVRNRWLFDFGLIACALVIPWAFAFGEVRGIPVGWRLVDCSFGLLGAVPLWLCRRWAMRLERVARDKS